MKRRTVEHIWALWDAVEADEPDISTERLCQTVADQFNLLTPGARLEAWQVAEALEHRPVDPHAARAR